MPSAQDQPTPVGVMDTAPPAGRGSEPGAPATGWLSLETVYVVAAIGIAVAAAFAIGIRPNDFWWHLAYGRTIVETGAIPATDTFTYTHAGEPFFNQMWLAQVVMYLLHRAGGTALVLAGHAAAIGLAYGLALRLCIRLTGRARLSSLVMLGAVIPISFYNWAVRPQAYAFPLFVGFVVVLWRYDAATGDARSWRRLALLPALMLVWVNVHGSFVTGVALVGIVTAAEAWNLRTGRSSLRGVAGLAGAAVATVIATAVNPAGPAIYGYVARLTSHPSVAEASEWRPVSISNMQGLLFVAGVVAVLLLMVHAPRRPTVRETLLVVAFAVLGFTAIRNTVWFALVAAPLAVEQATSLLGPVRRDRGTPLINGVLVAAIVAGIVLMTPWVRGAVPDAELPVLRDTPTGAVAYLRALEQPPRRLFNQLGYGSYIPWAAPEIKTFIDPRFELFPPREIRDYRDLTAGRLVQPLIEQHDLDGFVLSHDDQPDLIRELRSSPDWREAYTDEESVVFLPAQ